MNELTVLWILVGVAVVLSLIVSISGCVALYQDWRR